MLSTFLSGLALGDNRGLIFSGNYQNGAFDSLTFVNPVVGWDLFFDSGFRGGSTVIGNIEAGHVWGGHGVFTRAPGVTNVVTNHMNTSGGALNQLDYHATMVGHVLAGSGYVPDNGGSYTFAGLGMAPESALVSGAIATGFSSTQLGSFTTTGASVASVYESFFTGNGVAKPDVINSSWGGGDPAASSFTSVAIDGLARQNPGVVLVASAGNGGSAAVGAPASGFNNISVGSLGGAGFRQPSSFSSSGRVDFYNPEANTTQAGVRSAVDIAAPGERLVLAAYLGNQGGIAAALPGQVVQPSPTDQYFLNMDGTSFSAPVVAGGIALLKDAANVLLSGNTEAADARVLKSVIMAGAEKTEGWDNGQNSMNVTTQGLDSRTGAGSLDLASAAQAYYFGTQGMAGSGGGSILANGWDLGSVDANQTIEYVMAMPFTEEMTLSVALNWFSVRDYSSMTAADIAFVDLDLEVWSIDGAGGFLSKVGESITTYDNTEFLRFDSLPSGRYGFRVVFDDIVFDTSDAVTGETFGIAWHSVAVPEPSALGLGCAAVTVLLRRRRAQRAGESRVRV